MPDATAATDSRPIALCYCGAPLVSTFAFRGAEFLCLDCGAQLGFLSPRRGTPTPALCAQTAAVEAEFAAHVGGKLLIPGAWRHDCPQCEPHRAENMHVAHATDAEREADATARRWLQERRKPRA